ncbi:MAG: ActS/PrrB/RegB family redox-sensitive histidine kinase [Ahrensia sp.]|nr:ActS/PrrB/RegB family redox-sensitive histidine kinase [Ahrensia sp.]
MALEKSDNFNTPRLRLATVTTTRWLAVLGQSIVLTAVAGYLEFSFPVVACFVLVALSALLNVFVTWLFPATQRLGPNQTFAILLFDILQLTALLYLTGGLANPFAILLIVPAIISATVLPINHTALLSVLVTAVATVLVVFHMPLPWEADKPLNIPFVLIAGMWTAIISTLLFATFYVYRVAAEARRLANALANTELVYQREQHLYALDGMAAAAAHELGTPLATISLVAKEMDRAATESHEFKEDIILLRSQADRCREILGRLSTLGSDAEDPTARMPITVMIEEIVSPHREFGVDIETKVLGSNGHEPIVLRNTGLMYGLGNIVENAVDFARNSVVVKVSWTQSEVIVAIQDDGPGIAPDQLTHLGEPDIRSIKGAPRSRKGSNGLGLGIFIAKTLLERSGANVNFANSALPGLGALVTVRWTHRSNVEKRA